MARHIYVHIPFCIRKCDYCDFYSVANNSDEIMSRYFDALEKEIELTKIVDDVNPDSIDTVYFGGGTPSVPDSKYICDVLKKIINKFDIKEDAEITIECNPASVTYEKFCDYKKAGFNRVSIGVQSLNDETLKTLGRLHSSSRAIEAIKEAFLAGFTNVSADLMLGIPGQSLDEVMDNARKLVDLSVNHVSMYSLIIEEGTKFYDRYSDSLESFVSQELERQMYHNLRDYLNSKGITPYEISNCGKMSIHNMSYWEGYEYYAFGPAASGYLEKKRFTHHSNVNKYIEEISENENFFEKILVIDEILGYQDMQGEYAMLMLRTSKGIVKSEFLERFGVSVTEVFADELGNLIDKDLIIDVGQAFVLTEKGLDFANEVFREFI